MMNIILRLDYDGEPYIKLEAGSVVFTNSQDALNSQVLELFIKKAKQEGIRLVNDSDMDSCNSYASIKLGTGEL